VSSDLLDVVLVPDFSGRAAVTFEARLLYFLASWIEYSGVCGKFPLHLACIGEPPRSVRQLADRCGARITLHPPAGPELGIYANKLRGFEVALETERTLLLDVDIIAISDLSPLARMVPSDAIAAAPNHAAIIREEMWEELYRACGVPPPDTWMSNAGPELVPAGTPGARHPSYNSGVLVVPRGSDLLPIWLEHLRVLGGFRERWTEALRGQNMLVGDEPALATALQVIQRRGIPFKPLPYEFNGRWLHLYRRSPTLREFGLFHMTSSFIHGKTLREKLDPASFAYQRKLLRRYGRHWMRHSTARVRDALRLVPASIDLLELRRKVKHLYDAHLRDLTM
jgi:hypothetical protein